ncbi:MULTISPECIES: hypothetical protein [Bacillaceae]|uniref:hypothetical protein n=1 Tax=Bacillaceae TaxID=186817 RepID=UPI0020A15209|nr:hypothetical protein [Bacillus infantis]MCP1156676.1 hypothetical protein [Bacillus infantis]MDW2878704.1 hypothetical protein [Bacillus infantis]
MYWETMPGWFWAIYYSILFSSMVAAVYCIMKEQLKIPSVILIFFVLSVPIASTERGPGINEMEYFIGQLQQGIGWTLFSLAGYLLFDAVVVPFLFQKEVSSQEK